MNLEAFIEKQIALVEMFRAYWLKGREICPEDFPMELNEEEWDEQFASFKSNGKEV